MSTHNLCFHGEIRKNITRIPPLNLELWYGYTSWSGTLLIRRVIYLRIIAGVVFNQLQASLAIMAMIDVLPEPDSPCSTRGSLLIPSTYFLTTYRKEMLYIGDGIQ